MIHPAIIVAASIAGTLALGLAIWFWLRRRHRSSIRDMLTAIAIEHLQDVLVPDGMGGEIHCEHLVLSIRGILVINVKRYEGVVFAGDRMDQWTAIGAAGRSTFQNPLPSLFDRVAAVRQLVRDIDVRGFVVFPATADFSKGRPSEVMLPDDLLDTCAKPEKTELARMIEAFEPHWDKIRAAVRPASS